MKAARLHMPGTPEDLRLEEVPEPTPGPTEVLVRVAAAGICGHDQSDRMGLTRTSLPAILGHEISGTITAIGAKVHAFKEGDRVACLQGSACGWCTACRGGREMECPQRHGNHGGWAEYATIDEQGILPVPDSVDLEGASIIACAVGTCLRALRVIGKVMPGETVLVTGAGGGLGIHGLQVAKALGARAIALTSSPSKAEQLRAIGADDVVVAEGRDYWQTIVDATGGIGPDVVLDNVGHPDVFTPCYRAMRGGGRYVFTGQVYRAKIDLYPAFIFGKEAIITGSRTTRMNEFVDSMRLVEDGLVKPVFETYSLDNVAEANRDMDNRAVFGRAVLVP